MSDNMSVPILPVTTFADLNQIYLRAADQIKRGKDYRKVLEINSLRNLITHNNQKISTGACCFLSSLLKLMKPNSQDYVELLNLISKKIGTAKHNGVIINLVLSIITENYNNIIENKKTSKYGSSSSFPVVYKEIVEDILYMAPDTARIFLKHFELIKPKTLKSLYGSLLLKLLFDQIPVTNVHSSEFWNLLSKTNDLIYYLIPWIKENDTTKLNHILSLCPQFDQYKELLALFQVRVFCNFCHEGLHPVGLSSKLQFSLFRLCDVVQSIICTVLAINLTECAANLATEYLALCLELVNKGCIFKEILQLLKVELLVYSGDYCYFPEIKKMVHQLNIAIDNKIQLQDHIKNPIILNMSTRFLIKRYTTLNRAFIIVKLLYSFYSNRQNISKWLKKFLQINSFYSQLNIKIAYGIYHVLLLYGEDSVKEEAINLLPKLKRKNTFFTYYLFFVDPNPRMKYTILKSLCTTKKSEEEEDLCKALVEKFDNSPLNSEAGIIQNICLHLNNCDSYVMKSSKGKSMEYVLGHVLALQKQLEFNARLYLEEFLPELNDALNYWLSLTEGVHVVSSIMDCLTCLCEQKLLYVESIWSEMVAIITMNDSDCILRSFFRFLSVLPIRLREKHMRKKDLGIISKSVNILWNFIAVDKAVSKDAVKALSNFGIENFDRMLLTCDHGSKADPLDDDYKLLRGAIPEMCWLHLLEDIKKEYCISLFTVLIEKESNNSISTACDNYDSLFRALYMYLVEVAHDGIEYFDPENEPLTDICLSLLSVKWNRSNCNFAFLRDLFLQCKEVSLQNRILNVLIYNSSNVSARQIILNLLDEEVLLPDHMKCICLSLEIQNYNYEVEHLKQIIQFGLQVAFNKEDCRHLGNKLLRPLRNHNVALIVRQTFIVNIISIWKESKYGTEQFLVSNDILAKFDRGFFDKLPIYSLETEACKKYIALYSASTINSKTLSHFEKCIEFTHKAPRLKKFVLSHWIKVLTAIGYENLKTNRQWLLTFIATKLEQVKIPLFGEMLKRT
ncbi:uncharacterized protein LOC106672521 isoform X2 [Cimex lectularius]|uniref:Uncharacterized protein n=1 Tax=Cimex lectularius TaxID=79782 RepID=A0A8I6SE28_CIMLE|nr:uncharacterized protein LOC106672521 isoform X2 [Cimex lectularius]